MFLTPEYLFIGLLIVIVIFLLMKELMRWAVVAILILFVYFFIKYKNLFI
ncbi:hypothetical protein HY500_02215 [Candidatus Woesearchaeota archaeon]|nr:hypothetical protein [Candidatus Woesearchaeota archaeon]